MDWLSILALDDFWFQGLFMGAFPYLVFGQWKFSVAWLVMWIFLGTSDNPAFPAFAIFLCVLYCFSRLKLSIFVASKGS